MRMVDLIAKKRRGGELTSEELQWMIDGYVKGEIPDYQFSAFLMAVCFQGCTAKETAELTLIMARSGDMLDLSALEGVKVDKHSTGGVADTTTLIVAPLVAACGLPVVKMSGRGLGHTGGTLDKLESIPGVNTAAGMEAFLEMARANGIAVVGQSGDLCPADKLIYALRDVTATVDSIPLIASSIMSKKIAAGCDAIVLDVKVGSGAFMEKLEDAKALARAMVEIGERVGRRTVAILTDMNQPLGRAIGNSLEIEEAVDALSGRLPLSDPLMEVSFLLGSQMYMLGKGTNDEREAREALEQALTSGRALKKLETLLTALGGDGKAVIEGRGLPQARSCVRVEAKTAGYIASMNAQELGRAALLLGAGRATKADVIDPAVGVVMKARVGERVERGTILAEMRVNDDTNMAASEQCILDAIKIGEERVQPPPMVYGIVGKTDQP